MHLIVRYINENIVLVAECIFLTGLQSYSYENNHRKALPDKKLFAECEPSVASKHKLRMLVTSQVEILKQLKEYELFTMADAMQEMIYEEGDVICRQGDAGRR